jgi:ribosome-binding protein aMBF1 (putative translation factor)
MTMFRSNKHFAKFRRDLSSMKALRQRVSAMLRDFELQDDQVLPTLDSRIEQLSQQLSQYSQRHIAEIDADHLALLPDLPCLLIKARLFLGWTQKELAERTGLRAAQICTYEKESYVSIRLGKAIEIAEVMRGQLAKSRSSQESDN